MARPRNQKIPRDVDVYVGTRLRLARAEKRMSQERLGEHLGITFQQIQKYEKGTNRIGASRLYDISVLLNKSVGWFFDGLSFHVPSTMPSSTIDPAVAFASTIEGAELIHAFKGIKNAKTRKHLIEFLESMNEK